MANMKTALLFPVLLAVTVQAQTAPEFDFVSRLNADLLPLSALPALSSPLEDGVSKAAARKTVSPEQNAIMDKYRQDLIGFERQRDLATSRPDSLLVGMRSFFSWDEAYKLTSALAGKELSEGNLTPLSEAIRGIANSAVVCRNTGSALLDSAEFRASAEKANDALRALGVSNHDARAVMEMLFSRARVAAVPAPRMTFE
jgi:hypothetical protein